MRDQRTPVPGQRATITVAELAAELGRSLPRMYDLCNAQQVYARGPGCPISASNAHRLRDAHHDLMRRTEILRRTPMPHDFAYDRARTALGGSAGPADDDSDTTAIARNLGVRPHHRARPARTPAEPPLTGTAAAAVRVWPGTPHERAQEIAALWTGKHYFTDVKAAAWWTVGQLGPDDALLASVLREHGIRPEHMPMVVKGDSIAYRLRELGIAPEWVARILRDKNLL